MLIKLYSNLKNSLNGIKISLKEYSFRLEILLGLILLPLLILTQINITLKLLIFTLYSLLLSLEIFNTAIEKLCDKITKEINPDIKKIKDLSSAAVFMVLISLFVVIFIAYK